MQLYEWEIQPKNQIDILEIKSLWSHVIKNTVKAFKTD
jgi:hypothetical protein